MDKTLYINEIHRDYQVKDYKTFPRDHAKKIKKLQKANIQLENEIIPKERRVKVKSVTNKKMIQVTKDNLKQYQENTAGEVNIGDWAFHCEVKVKIYDLG